MSPTAPLPPLVVVTDASLTRGRPLADVVAAAVRGGARAVLLREKHLPRTDRARLADRLRQILAPVGGALLMASDATIPADGVHLAAADTVPQPPPKLVGRSCHRPADVARAGEDGCHYATLSPIFLTASKPGYGPALGPAVLADLPLPVWALGGVAAANAAVCMAAGAAGVAVMGAIMAAPDPAAAVAAINAAVGAVAA